MDGGFAVQTASTAWAGARLLAALLPSLAAAAAGAASPAAAPLARTRILSLGAGTGNLELALAASGARVLATDHPAALEALEERLARGAAAARAAGGSVRAAALDWTAVAAAGGRLPPDCTRVGGGARGLGPGGDAGANFDADGGADGGAAAGFDVVVASDCVFWPELFSPLVSALVAASELTPARPPLVVLAVEPRARAELAFFDALDAAGLRWYRVDDGDGGSAAGAFVARRAPRAAGRDACG